jgi:hypothetical protein
MLLIEQPEDGELLLSMPIERVVEVNRTYFEPQSEPSADLVANTDPDTETEAETTVSARMVGPLAFYRIEELAQVLGFDFEISDDDRVVTVYAPELPIPQEEPDEVVLFAFEVPATEPNIEAYDYVPESEAPFEATLLITIFGVAGIAILSVIVLAIKLRK